MSDDESIMFEHRPFSQVYTRPESVWFDLDDLVKSEKYFLLLTSYEIIQNAIDWTT